MKLFKKNKEGDEKRRFGLKSLFQGKRKFIVIPILLLLVAGSVTVFLFRDRLFPPKEVEEEIEVPEPIDAPIQYQLKEAYEVLALPAGAHVLVYDATPEEPPFAAEEESDEDAAEAEKLSAEESEETEEEADGEDASEEEAEEEEPELTAIGYRYEGIKNAVGMVLAYTSLLTTEDMGFRFVNEELREPEEEELPDFEAARGTVYLFQELPEPEETEEATEETEEPTGPQGVAMRLDWEEGICTVILDIVPVPEEEKNLPGLGIPYQPITFAEAVDRFKAVHPSVLGLEGDTMESYQVYSMNGMVLINDQPCMHLDVYSVDENTQTNVAAGCYYISSDGLRLYELDTETNIMKELPGIPATVVVSQSPTPAPETEEAGVMPEKTVS